MGHSTTPVWPEGVRYARFLGPVVTSWYFPTNLHIVALKTSVDAIRLPAARAGPRRQPTFSRAQNWWRLQFCPAIKRTIAVQEWYAQTFWEIRASQVRAATDMRAIPFPRCAVTRAVATRAPVHAYGSFGAWRVSLGRASRLP